MTGGGIFTAEDDTHVVTVSPGDYVSLRGTYGAGLLKRFYWSAEFIGDVIDESIVLGGGDAGGGYSGILGGLHSDGNRANEIQIIPFKGILKHLYVRGIPLGAGAYSYRHTLYVNGAATGLSCVVIGPGTICNDLTTEVPVNPGDTVSYRREDLLGPSATTTYRNYGMIFVPDQVADPRAGAFILGGDNDKLKVATTVYHRPSGVHGGLAIEGWNVTESSRRQLGQVHCYLKNLFVQISLAPGAGASYTFTVFVNGVASLLTCTIGGANITGLDITHEVEINDWDVISLECAPAGGPVGSPADQHAHWGIGIAYKWPDITTLPATEVH